MHVMRTTSSYNFGAIVLIVGLLITSLTVTLRSTPTPQPASDEDVLSAGKDWPLSNGDWNNTRYSLLSQINTGNISDLRGAWVSAKFDDGALSRSAPVVKDELMFVTAGTSVYALYAKTGQLAWRFQTDVRKPVAGLETASGMGEVILARQGLPNNQGVAAAEGKVFVGITDGRVIALKEKTGELLWSRQTGDDPPPRGQSLSSAPIYARGLVFTGLANGDFGLRGRVVALDAETGKEVWHFFTVPSPSEIGHETWPKNSDVWRQGGAGVWLPGTVDADLGMVYFVTGNPSPPTGGEVRSGDNLFTCSVVALEMKTGKLQWFYQFIHHDLWDADMATPPVLYTAEFGGRQRKAIAAMRPDGYLFLLDRETGKPLIAVDERAVPQDLRDKTAATQPFPSGADSVLPDCSEWRRVIPAGFVLGCPYTPFSLDKFNVLATWFSVRVSPMSYSPQTGYFYVQGGASLGGRRRLSEDPWFFTVGGASANPGIGLLNLPGRAFFGAIDSRTDKIIWRKEVPVSALGRSGSMSTAGGLMFRGGDDGNFEAYDARSGALLWQFQVGSPATPASTYELDGEQYVAMSAGSSVWAFRLGGTIQPTKVVQQRAAGSESAGGLIVDTDHIETASLVRDLGLNGQRYAIDEHRFNPTRARAKAGTLVRWMNNGKTPHTIVAQDGSWTTGAIAPGQEASILFEKPGIYLYKCKEHPWAIGQLTVVAETDHADGRTPKSSYTEEQVQRGKDRYSQNCSSCHGDGLDGSGQAPPLLGPTFLSHWGTRSLAELFGKISTTMPFDNPGTLSPQAYLDITEFLLYSNGR
jgi:outer membrane protein assembly factor BamB/plastocyanin